MPGDVGRLVAGRSRADFLATDVIIEHDRRRLHRLADIEQYRERLVFDLNQLHRFFGDVNVVRRDCRDRVPLVKHLLASQHIPREMRQIDALRGLLVLPIFSLLAPPWQVPLPAAVPVTYTVPQISTGPEPSAPARQRDGTATSPCWLPRGPRSRQRSLESRRRSSGPGPRRYPSSPPG